MSRFDEALDATVAIVEATPFVSTLKSATMIRDLIGRVRLVLEFKQDANGSYLLPSDWGAVRNQLDQQLGQRLGPYWGAQIWRVGERRESTYSALEQLIEANRLRWDQVPTTLGGTLQWYKLERVFSKSSWLANDAVPPWTLDDPANPAIVSFYSFKGGVGRTITVAATALFLARAHRRVVVLDLDLEAPGVGPMLLGDIAPPENGVVDYLLERQLCGRRPDSLDLYVAVQPRSDLIGEDGEPIRVLTAGRLTRTFPEKIARLDFESYVTQGLNPLEEMLGHIRAEYAPEFILLDVRSGLHDLGGLSLNGLSHLDVLFGLDTPQSWGGLELVLPILGVRARRCEVLLAHAMVTPARFDSQANLRFRAHAFDLFRDYYYREDEEMPDIADESAPYGLGIPYEEGLLNVSSLTQVVGLLTRPGGPYERLTRLIGTYLARGTV